MDYLKLHLNYTFIYFYFIVAKMYFCFYKFFKNLIFKFK